MSKQPEEPPEDDHVLIAIVLLLLAGLTLEEFTSRLAGVLAPLGISAEATVAMIGMLHAAGGLALQLPDSPDGAIAVMQRGLVSRRAMYMLAAARRVADGEPIEAELRLYQAHLRAEDRRRGAAQRIAAAAARFGPVLGWKARLDGRTTPECRSAHGSNFSALRPPAIGWPGTLHAGNCRCVPTAPWSQGILLP